jgi:hypothetical protein
LIKKVGRRGKPAGLLLQPSLPVEHDGHRCVLRLAGRRGDQEAAVFADIEILSAGVPKPEGEQSVGHTRLKLASGGVDLNGHNFDVGRGAAYKIEFAAVATPDGDYAAAGRDLEFGIRR